MKEATVYMIVPFKDVTKAMVDISVETSLSTLRHSVKGIGEDRVVLKFMKYKSDISVIEDVSSVRGINDVVFSDIHLSNNDKYRTYPYAHKTTPVTFNAYKQYGHEDILKEMDKEDWKSMEIVVVEVIK